MIDLKSKKYIVLCTTPTYPNEYVLFDTENGTVILEETLKCSLVHDSQNVINKELMRVKEMFSNKIKELEIEDGN